MINITHYVWMYDHTVFVYVCYLAVLTYVLIAMLSIARVLLIDNGFITLFGIESVKGWLDIWLNYAVDRVLDAVIFAWRQLGEPLGHIVITCLFYVFIVAMAVMAAVIFCCGWVVDYIKQKS